MTSEDEPPAAATTTTSNPPSSQTPFAWSSQERTSLPIRSRPKPPGHPLRLAAFLALFSVSCVCIHANQLLLWPFKYVSSTRKWYDQGLNFTKKQFGMLCLWCIQSFAPTKLQLTLEQDLDQAEVVKPTPDGQLKLNLPQRHVVMSNHQVYLDWMFIWVMLYLSDLHGSVVIILKNTLKWIPILGPAMQFFQFIFVARSWESDKHTLRSSLASLGQRATASQEPLSLLIFPEGTLVSQDTRPISARFAEKQGYPDMKHALLPRATGLHTCLRALARKIPDLKLVDLTIGYEGVPPQGYGQDYYTLAAYFGFGDAPPKLHVHYRELSVADVPIGDIANEEPTTAEREAFAAWLLEQWRAKDALLAHFYSTGSFEGGRNVAPQSVAVPLEMLQEGRDTLRLFAGLLPGLAASWEALKAVWRYVW